MFGNTPAHGLFTRHAEGIEVSDYKVLAAQNARPCFLLDEVQWADFLNIKTGRMANSSAFILDIVKGRFLA